MTLTELRQALDRIEDLPAEVRADAIGALAAAQAKLFALLASPVPVATSATTGPELLPTDAMAARAGVSVFWLREQANAARIPVSYAGRRLLFDPVKTIAAIKALERSPRRRKDGGQDKRSWAPRRQKARDSRQIRPNGAAVGGEVSTNLTNPAVQGAA